MTLPRVSVHIVTYNQKDFIGPAIESSLSQGYPDLQIVVSDDASTDGTDAIVRSYAERFPDQVVAITGGPNLGICGNENRALERCDGVYVAFLAGDDLMLPGKIRAQVDWLDADPARVLCSHDVEHFDSATGKTFRLHSSMAEQRFGTGTGEFIRGGYFPATSSLMARRSAIPNPGFDERIRVFSDYKFAADVLANGGKFGYVPGVLGRYRRHGKNATIQHAILQWEEIHVSLALIEVEHPEFAADCQAAKAFSYYQRAVSLISQGNAAEGRDAIKTALRHDPLVSWKLPLWWLVSQLPPGVSRALHERRLQKMRSS
ncbi:MAG TPA: glycosyltransferase [Polyangiaceae bacterium]|nr:glycosyltransferase [Polyangiaceae bacterium]